MKVRILPTITPTDCCLKVGVIDVVVGKIIEDNGVYVCEEMVIVDTDCSAKILI